MTLRAKHELSKTYRRFDLREGSAIDVEYHVEGYPVDLQITDRSDSTTYVETSLAPTAGEDIGRLTWTVPQTGRYTLWLISTHLSEERTTTVWLRVVRGSKRQARRVTRERREGRRESSMVR